MADRVFLDANVLFSAAYRADAGLAGLWKFRGVTLLSSEYARVEAETNLTTTDQKARLARLVVGVELIDEPIGPRIRPSGIHLPEKDWPILSAAIHAGATHLLTGDHRHFGPLFGKKVGGVTILTPADYLVRR